jgi:hypothetical protein
MTTVIGGSSPSITFSDSTTQTTAFTSTPSVTTITTSADASISGLTVGKGGGAVSTNATVGGLTANTTGTRNTSFGVGSLATTSTANDSTAVGWNALNLNTGTQNTAVGRSALESNSSGTYNVAIGFQSLVLNTTASNNTAVGYQAGYSNNGSAQTFVGYQAGYAVTSGTYNCYVGYGAGVAATTGSYNTFIGGINSGYAVTTGSKNTILGSYSGNNGGLDIRTASNYIVLSDGDGNPNLFIDNNKVIRTTLTTGFSGSAGTIASNGYSAKAGLTGAFSGNITNLNWQSGTAHFWIDTTDIGQIAFVSDYRIKRNIETQTESGLDKVLKLRPVTYQMADYKELFKAGEEIKEGFIAHEVQAIIPSGVDGEKDAENQIQSLRLDAILAVAVKAIQELSAQVTTLQAQVTALQGK